LLLVCFLPETIHSKRIAEQLKRLSRMRYLLAIARQVNPFRMIKLYRYSNLCLTFLAGAGITWNIYSLLTPIVEVLNPRFNLTSPLEGGLFYIAPGVGYIFGTLLGGWWADYTANKWTAKSDGIFHPEDRLHSCIIWMGVISPICMVIYGWCVEMEAGGIPVPVIAMAVESFAQLICIPSLNTYTVDVLEGQSAEGTACSFQLRYVFAAVASAAALPAIRAMGVGGFSTLSAGMGMLFAAGVWLVIMYGEGWRKRVDANKVERKVQQHGIELQDHQASDSN
jgi:MFS family permease